MTCVLIREALALPDHPAHDNEVLAAKFAVAKARTDDMVAP